MRMKCKDQNIKICTPYRQRVLKMDQMTRNAPKAVSPTNVMLQHTGQMGFTNTVIVLTLQHFRCWFLLLVITSYSFPLIRPDIWFGTYIKEKIKNVRLNVQACLFHSAGTCKEISSVCNRVINRPFNTTIRSLRVKSIESSYLLSWLSHNKTLKSVKIM